MNQCCQHPWPWTVIGAASPARPDEDALSREGHQQHEVGVCHAQALVASHASPTTHQDTMPGTKAQDVLPFQTKSIYTLGDPPWVVGHVLYIAWQGLQLHGLRRLLKDCSWDGRVGHDLDSACVLTFGPCCSHGHCLGPAMLPGNLGMDAPTHLHPDCLSDGRLN